MEVPNIVQEAVIKTIPKKKKCKKAKCLFEEALQIAENRREAKGKKEKEKYTHLNTEFQRIARREKKAFSEECKEIEENSRMGKTRDLFKKIRDTKGTRDIAVPSTTRRSNQSILKEISPEYSLEGLMLKLKLHYFGPPDAKN